MPRLGAGGSTHTYRCGAAYCRIKVCVSKVFLGSSGCAGLHRSNPGADVELKVIIATNLGWRTCATKFALRWQMKMSESRSHFSVWIQAREIKKDNDGKLVFDLGQLYYVGNVSFTTTQESGTDVVEVQVAAKKDFLTTDILCVAKVPVEIASSPPPQPMTGTSLNCSEEVRQGPSMTNHCETARKTMSFYF